MFLKQLRTPTPMSGDSDEQRMIVTLLAQLRTSLDALTTEVHHLRADLKANQNDYIRISTNVTALQNWRELVDAKLRDLAPVASILEQLKKWLVLSFALFFMGGLILTVVLFLWTKVPNGVLAPALPQATIQEPRAKKILWDEFSWFEGAELPAAISGAWSIIQSPQSPRSVSSE